MNTEPLLQWNMLGRRVPQTQVVYFTQMFMLFIVVIASIINLSLGDRKGAGPPEMRIAHLGSSLGMCLPAP